MELVVYIASKDISYFERSYIRLLVHVLLTLLLRGVWLGHNLPCIVNLELGGRQNYVWVSWYRRRTLLIQDRVTHIKPLVLFRKTVSHCFCDMHSFAS
jgi:hypothetical protein